MQNSHKANQKKQIEIGKEQIYYNYQREKYLRYGDYIILKSSEIPYQYLSSRSIIEKNVYYLEQHIEVEIDDYNIIDYPNFSELIFAIYPNHYYEASKAYDKIQLNQMNNNQKNLTLQYLDPDINQQRINLENMSGKEINKYDTLRRRMEAEIEINNKRVSQFKGQYVTIGQEIMLYHVYSNSFIKATREKSDEDQNLFHIKLTQTPSSSTHFIIRINPYLNFKKDGEKIAYDELFYFENTKYHTVFSIQSLQDAPILVGSATNLEKQKISQICKVPMLTLNSDISKKQMQAEETSVQAYKKQAELIYTPTLEQMVYFTNYGAGHRKVQKDRIDTFQAVFIKKAPIQNISLLSAINSNINQASINTKGQKKNQNQSSHILQGDYVRLKHILRSSKKTTVIHTESNVCGYAPKVFAVVKDDTNMQDKESLCDIFQIIPEKESDLGVPIEFDNLDYGETTIRLRHLLTGKCLMLNQKKMELSNSMDDQLMEARKNVVQNRRKKKNKEKKTDSQGFGENGDIRLNTKESSVGSGSGKEEMQEYIDQFKEATEFVLQNAGRDEPYLLTTTTFQLKNSDQNYVKISEHDVPSQELVIITQQDQEQKSVQKNKQKNRQLNTYQSLPGQICSEDYFQSWFIQMDTLKRKYYPLYSDDQEGDFFYFELVNEQIISDFNTLNCHLDPLIQLCEETPKNIFQKEVILQAKENITILGLWLCDIKLDNLKEKPKLDQINSIPISRKQIIFRDIGIIDMTIKIILHTYRFEYLCMDNIQNNIEIYQFIQTAIDLLIKLSFKSFVNSMYIISWYSLFKKIILDSEVIMEFKFDKLVNQLFKETNINVSFQDDLRQIANEISYEDINLNALNLLLSFCQYNPYRKKQEHEEIIQFLFENEKTRKNIFRAFKLDDQGKVYLELENENNNNKAMQLVKHVIDKDFQFISKDLYLYSMQVVNLTSELCKGGPSLIIDYIKKYYDFKVCMHIIGNDEIASAYRAIFLNLFKESYLVNDFKYTLVEDLPSLIKVKSSIGFQETLLEGMFMKFRERINLKYFYQLGEDDENNSIYDQNMPENKSIFQDKSHINLKLIIDKFLQSFTTLYFKEQNESKDLKYEVNELASSILSLCHFILQRGFYTNTEIIQLEKTIYEIFQQAYIFRKIKVNYKGALKNKKVGGLLVTKNIHIPIEMVNWISIAINILHFIEDLSLEELVQRLFQDNKFNKYFGEDEEKVALNNKDGTKNQQFLQEKKDKIVDFFDLEQSQRNIKNIFVLCEMLLLDNIELKGKIVDTIYKQFSQKKRYYECLNNCITIDINNERIYQTLNELYYIIHFCMIDIQFQKSQEVFNSSSNISKMSEAFTDLISFLFDENPPDDLVELASLDLEDGDVQANPVKPSIDTHQRVHGLFTFQLQKSRRQIGTQKTIQENNQQDGIELNQINYDLNAKNRDYVVLPSRLARDYESSPALNNLNGEQSKSSQNSPKIQPFQQNIPAIKNISKSPNISIQESRDNKRDLQINEKHLFRGDSNVMYSILDQHYIEIASLYNNQRLLKNMNFHKLLMQIITLFGDKQFDKEQENSKQKNNIIKSSLMGLIYFTLQNEENQDLILQHQDYPEVIKTIFGLKHVEGMLELTFIFISQIYKDNYSILLSLNSHFAKQGKFVLKSLFANFFDTANKNDKTYCIYFIQFLKYFFTINGKNISQNQTLLFKIFSDESISSKQQIQSIITKAIQNICIDHENPMNKLDTLNNNQNLREEDYVIKVPQEAILIQQMLTTFREFTKGSGLAVNTFVRMFFSLQDIRTILSYCSWIPSLKKEALDFLVEVYLNSKNIEPNEFREIQVMLLENLYQDLVEYQRFTRQTSRNRHNIKWRCKGDSLNLFENRNPYGSIRYLITMNYLYGYEYYILNSIIPCLQSYFNKLSDIPSDQQFQLASQFESICKRLEKYWDNEENITKKMLDEEYEDCDGGLMVNFDIDSKENSNAQNRSDDQKSGGLILNFPINYQRKNSDDSLPIRNKSQTRKMYSKKVSGTTIEKKQKKTDMIKGTLQVLSNLTITEKYRNIQMKQQNILTNYNYEAAFAMARQNRPVPFFQKSFIENEHEQELENLISTLIEIKIQDQQKFRTIIQSFIAVLSCDTIETNIRMNSMKILRKISNYRQDSKVNESIQHDLISMGFLNFLCDIIIIEQDPLMKLEYIRGLIDFMEESNKDIQDSFYQYLLNDKDNRFLLEINSFLQQNFHSSKSNQGLFEDKGQHQQHFKRILVLKFEICMRSLELLRLSTENHYRPMQDFLREQINQNGEKKSNSVNMINQLSQMFEKYRKVMQDDDLQLGIKILDTLIEWIQGPCEENQLALCHTNLLENLEDMQYDISQRTKKKGEYQKYRSEFNQKTILILRSLFEGNFNPYITKKVSMYVDIRLMIDTITQNFKLYQEYIRKISNVHQGLLECMKNKNFKFEGEFDQTQYISQETHVSPLSADELIQKYETSSVLSTSVTSSFMERSATNAMVNSIQVKKEKKSSTLENTELYEKADNVISEAFERYLLVKNLKFLDPTFSKKYEEVLDFQLNKLTNPNHEDVRKALIFMEDNTCSIEIINQKDHIQKVYFRNPPITQYLSTISKDRFQDKVQRDGSTEKITGLLAEEPLFLDEMQHFLKLNALGIYFNLTYLSWARNFNLSLAFLINIFLLIDVFSTETKGKTIASIFQYLNLGISILVIIFWVIFEMPLELKLIMSRYEELTEEIKQKQRSVGKKKCIDFIKLSWNKVKASLKKLFFMIKQATFNSHFVYLLIYFFFSLGGILWNDLFYSLLLLDIIERSLVLQNVIKAVTQNIIQVLMTVVLEVTLIYIYSMIGYFSPTLKETFLYYGPGTDEHYNICNNAITCFSTFLNQGIRAGGGIADYLYTPSQDDPTSEYISRFFFDISFKIITIIIMLNILFGIIIDTFGELREERNEKMQDKKNKCFICNIERSQFENNRINFQKHLTKQHNTWNYFFYLIHLRFKNINDFDGTESYVYQKYRKQDISWFPIGQSLKLQKAAVNEDDQDKNEI
ncbi:hypothetical protein ABPG72_009219 [Tetrahymena utriculariae]